MKDSIEIKETINDEVVETPIVQTPIVTTPAVAENKVLDLIDILTQPTQKRAEVTNADEVVEHTPVSQPGIVEFDTEKVEAVKGTTASFVQASTIAVSYDSDKLADTVIDLVDTILTNVSPYIYEACLSKTERSDLKLLAREFAIAKAEKKKYAVTKEREDVIILFDNIQKYEELMPLSDAEKHSIKEPLKALLKEINYESSPKNALWIACGMIAVPRIIPLVPLLFKKFKRKEVEVKEVEPPTEQIEGLKAIIDKLQKKQVLNDAA